MKLSSRLQDALHLLIEYRLLLSIGLSAACGIVLQTLYPVHDSDPLLRLVALERPAIYRGLVWSYGLFLYSTPFLLFSMLFSLAYVHLYAPRHEQIAGPLPPYPDPLMREELELIVGEVHHQLKPDPSPAPRWLSISGLGLYTGICVVGAIGSGKTQPSFFQPCASYLPTRLGPGTETLRHRARSQRRSLPQARRILKDCGRAEDYIDVSLNGDIRYNPLNNDARCLRAGVQHRLDHRRHLGQRPRAILAAVLHRPCPVRDYAASRP